MAIYTYTCGHQASYYDSRYGEPASEPEKVEARAVDHTRSCPRGKPGWPDTNRKALTNDCVRHGCRIGYRLTTHTGRVLSLRERNGYHDSDFLATVWTDDGPKEIEYASTRGWTYFNGAEIDATPEVLEVYRQYREGQRRKAEEAKAKRQAHLAELRASMPAFGQTWRVKSKRSKLPHGALVEIAYDPQLGNYAAGLHRYPIGPAETLEERWSERPSDVTVKVRTASGSLRWVSCSVLEPFRSEVAA